VLQVGCSRLDGLIENFTQSGFHLLLIRHGQSGNNASPHHQRVHDTPLTDLGHSQAAQLADHLVALDKIDVLLTSPFLRTLQTTRPLATASGLTPLIRTDLHETGGCYAGHKTDNLTGKPGMTAEEIAVSYPDYVLPDDIDHLGWWKTKTPETSEQAAVRAERQAAVLRREFAGTDTVVACVAHGDFIMLMLTAMLDQWPGHAEAPIPKTSDESANATNHDAGHPPNRLRRAGGPGTGRGPGAIPRWGPGSA